MKEGELLESYSVRGAKVSIYALPRGGFYEIEEPSLGSVLCKGRFSFNKSRKEKCDSRYLLNQVIDWALRSPFPLGPEGSEKSLVLQAGEEMGLEDKLAPFVDVLSYYVWRDLLAHGKVSIPLADPSVEEIALESYRRPLSLIHRRYPELGWMDTNITFKDEVEASSLVKRLAHAAGKEVSLAYPYLDLVTSSGDRVSLTYSSEVSLPGSSFSIRKFPEKPLTLKDLVSKGTLSPLMAAYYWLMVEAKAVIMFIGAMSAGKTTALAAVSSFIPETAKVATIEDVPELNLPNRRWQRFISRASRLGKGKEVTLMDLLVLSLRYRPDYVILGEARGAEISAFIQAAALGHGAMTTFHAESPQTALVRLYSPPLSVSATGASLITVFSLMARSSPPLDAYEAKKSNQPAREKRRNIRVTELGEDGKLRDVFQWVPGSEQFYPADPLELLERSNKLRSISDSFGWSTAQAVEELNRRAKTFGRGPDLADVDWVLLGSSYLAYPSAGYPAPLSAPVAG